MADHDIRVRLLDAARRILRDASDPRELTVRSVAAEVGVSQGAVYLHFHSRDELAGEAALVERMVHERRTRARIRAYPDAADRIRERLLANVAWSRDHPAVYVALGHAFDVSLDVINFARMTSLREAGVPDVVNDIQQLIDEGRIPSPADAEMLMRLQIAFEAGFMTMVLKAPGLPWGPRDDFTAEYVEAQLLAIRLRPPAATPRE